MRKFLSMLAAIGLAFLPLSAYATGPTIMDTLPISLSSGNNSSNANSMHGSAASGSFTYTVPSGGTNKVEFVQINGGCANGAGTFTITQNGTSLTVVRALSASNQAQMGYAYLAAPTTGSFSWAYSNGASHCTFVVVTVQDADQANPIDSHTTGGGNAANTSDALSLTTNTANTLLFDNVDYGADATVITKDAAATLVLTNANGGGAVAPGNGGSPPSLLESYEATGAAGSYTITDTSNSSQSSDHVIVAIKYAAPAGGGAATQTPNFISFGWGF